MLLARSRGLSDAHRMSFAEFADALAPLPDEETWELVDGYPIAMMNPPSTPHQVILFNLLLALDRVRPADSSWDVLPGLGVNLAESDANAAIPDVVVKRPPWPKEWVRDPLAVFEILSPSTRGNDLGWKRDFYIRFPTLEHYVIVEQNSVRVRLASRADGWVWRDTSGLNASVTLPALDASLQLADLYKNTDLV
jgi:Uma2 family endonuclease